jgi:hypothetical protein
MSLTVTQLREALQALEAQGLGNVETTADQCQFYPEKHVPEKSKAWGSATVTTPASTTAAFVALQDLDLL